MLVFNYSPPWLKASKIDRIVQWPGGLVLALLLHGAAFALFFFPRAVVTTLTEDIPTIEVIDTPAPARAASPMPPINLQRPKNTLPVVRPSQVVQTTQTSIAETPIPLAASTPSAAPSNAAAMSHVSSSQSAQTQGNPSNSMNTSQAISPPSQPKVVTQGLAYLIRPDPNYPPLARRAGEEGTALIRVLVNAEGWPEQAGVQQSSGYSRLDEAARKGVLAARFRPHQENGQAIRVWAIVPISFTLEN